MEEAAQLPLAVIPTKTREWKKKQVSELCSAKGRTTDFQGAQQHVQTGVKSKSGPCDTADKMLASHWDFLWVTGPESESKSAVASQKHVTNQSGLLITKEEVGIYACQH